MPISQNTWRSIAIGATVIALFSLSPYSVSKSRDNTQQGGNKLDQIIARLDRIEKVVGCPVDEFVDGSCKDNNPVATTVSFCISQGRGLEIAGGWNAAFKGSLEGGARWDVVPLGDVKASLEFPVPVPLGPVAIPLPTEASIGGAAGIGRGLDICIDVPLEAADADASRLADLVKGMNAPPRVFDRTKFQRRLLRAIRFAERRTPPPASTMTVAADFDGNEFDRLDNAVERFMAGEFGAGINEPFDILKGPIVTDLRSSLDIPAPIENFLADPYEIFGQLPRFSDVAEDPAVVCGRLGLDGPIISQRFPNIAANCERLSNLPSFDRTSTAFETVHRINDLITNLPDEIIIGVSDILPDPINNKIPQARDENFQFCDEFPRLCPFQ